MPAESQQPAACGPSESQQFPAPRAAHPSQPAEPPHTQRPPRPARAPQPAGAAAHAQQAQPPHLTHASQPAEPPRPTRTPQKVGAARAAQAPLSYAIFSALYAPHVGGVEAYTAGLAGELARRGRRVTVITCRLAPEHPARETQSDGVDVLRLPCRPLLGGRLPLLRGRASVRQALSGLAETPPDRVVVNTRFYPLSLAGAHFAQRLGLPACVIEHGSAHLSLGNPLADKAVEAYEHRATERVKACGHPFCGVSAAALSWLEHFGIRGRGVVPNAIDPAAFAAQASARDFRVELGLSADAFLVAFVGRLVPEKGVDALLQAASEAACRPSLEQVAFAFAGDGPLASAVRDASRNVHALGPLSAPDVSALLRGADAVCLPSRSEGFATVLLEAAAMGTAPLVTHVGGVDELGIAHGRGIVLEDARPSTLLAALERAASQREACAQWGERLRDHARQHVGWPQTADTLEAIFDAYEAERRVAP